MSARRSTNGSALIDILALVLTVHGVALRAGAVGDATSDLDALSRRVTLAATSQLATSINLFIRWQASTVTRLASLAADKWISTK